MAHDFTLMLIVSGGLIMSDIDEIKKETKTILDAFLARVPFSPKDVFVLGISTSEIGGGQIGKDLSLIHI